MTLITPIVQQILAICGASLLKNTATATLWEMVVRIAVDVNCLLIET
jgi:hypothetical protein